MHNQSYSSGSQALPSLRSVLGGSKTPSPSISKERLSTKKYACNWPGCDKRFERQNALDTHMNIHTDSKPFVCPISNCGKAFNVRSNMRRHLLTHKEYQSGIDIDDEGSPKSGYAYPYNSSPRARNSSSPSSRS
ncbi:hypothetical protein Clacol_007207 [Clathrus columnatus]|uniref:C2H2-type domain-containing protein n=1 Tax=Clathrus columnatus TaxID=1419009 RepID=A0AAV5AFB6_9AGAM|nr:hypothetical protein Clacol_007207 [Clathrus columnatus]